MIAETEVSGPLDAEPRYLQWTPVIAGALAATALSLILVTFAAAVGLGVSSTSPTWRDASVALWLLSGLYLILQAIISFGFGGYIAGRMRRPLGARPHPVDLVRPRWREHRRPRLPRSAGSLDHRSVARRCRAARRHRHRQCKNRPQSLAPQHDHPGVLVGHRIAAGCGCGMG